MSRRPPSDRAEAVRRMAAALPGLVALALAAADEHGPDAPEARAAWEGVEQAGAVVHRQARILAGKPRGG